METRTARVRRSGSVWVVAFDDGESVTFQSDHEALAHGLQWVLTTRGSRLVLQMSGF